MQPARARKVLIVDDEAPARALLRELVADRPRLQLVGEAAHGLEAVELARRHRPDVCLFDIRMPELDGIEATRILAGPTATEPMAVVVITTFDLDEYVHGALKAGAKGKTYTVSVEANTRNGNFLDRTITIVGV